MAIKVHKVADIVGSEVIFTDNRKYREGDIMSILTNPMPVKNPNPVFEWEANIAVGVGKSTRQMNLRLPVLISTSDSLDSPLFLADGKVIYFRDRLFIPERTPKTKEEREEITLRVKKTVYDEEFDLANLRSVVANLEAAIEYKKTGPRRDPIPEDVKLLSLA